MSAASVAVLSHDHDHDHGDADHSLDTGEEPPMTDVDADGATSGAGGGPVGVRSPLSTLPLLDSNPNARVQLYLDFNGHVEPTWKSYRNVTSPVFSLDEDRTTFSELELAAIRETWAAVAEDFAPFNINVTTVDRGNFTNRNGLRVVIGGSPQDWYGRSAGGVAANGSFTNSEVNVAYVFSDFKWPNRRMDGIASTVSHEAGHSFGLQHQAMFDANGNFVNCYRPGDEQAGPLMGAYGSSQRAVWSNGNVTATRTQDDMAVLAAQPNVGYRVDDVGDSAATATVIAANSGNFSGSGLIGRTTDRDAFRFHSDGGTAVFAVFNNVFGANLVVKGELQDLNGRVLASATGGDHDPASLQAALPAGDYLLVVSSNGEYGSVGQYSFSGSVRAEPASLPLAPTNVQARSHFGNRHELTWTAASSAVGYRIYRRAKAGQPETLIETLPAGTTSVTLVASRVSSPEWSPEYRVEVFNGRGAMSSSFVTVAHDFSKPTQPGMIEVRPLSETSVQLTWTPGTGSEYQRLVVERYVENRSFTYDRFIILASNQPTVTLTGLTPGRHYGAYVTAVNPAGFSLSSTHFTMPHPSAPAAPTSLQVTRLANRVMELRWAAVPDATSYRVYSLTNNTMGFLASVSATTTQFRTTSLNFDQDYTFVVEAANASGGTQARFDVIRLTRTPPMAVTNLQTTSVTNQSVALSWTDSTGETGYRVRYTLEGVSSPSVTLDANVTNYTFSNLAPNKQYQFVITSFNEDGWVLRTWNVMTLPDPPTAIRNITATAVSSRMVDLNWSDSTGETRYSIYRITSTGRQLVANIGANVTTYRVTGLLARTTYRFVVVAFNRGGGTESEAITATTPA